MRHYSFLVLYVGLMTIALPWQAHASLGGFGGLLGGDAGLLPIADDVGSFDGGTIADLLCKVIEWFTGSVGQGIASLAVVVLGIGAAMGKVSYGMALTTMVGISVIFGAQDIVYRLTGQMPCYGDFLDMLESMPAMMGFVDKPWW